MVDLILRPTRGREDEPDSKDKWALQLRWHESLGETEYRTLCRVDDWTALKLMRLAAGWCCRCVESPKRRCRNKKCRKKDDPR